MEPAFRLRLPCIPFVPALVSSSSSLSLVKNCDLLPPPLPVLTPPIPIPPPPSQGCFEVNIGTKTQQGATFGLEVKRDYPQKGETGICEPVFTITLIVPGGGGGGGSDDGGGGKSGSGHSGSGQSTSATPPDFSCDTIDVLVDITCDPDHCTITKYFKKICYISCPCPDVGLNLVAVPFHLD